MPINVIPASPWTGRSDPEDGSGATRLHHIVQENASRALLGFACEAGVIRNKGRKGAHEGPAALRGALANMAAPDDELPFTDLGDVDVTGNDLEAGQAVLSDKVAEALHLHDRLIVLGGGHETAFGSYCGLTRRYPGKQIGIINLDAHLDLRLIGENGASSGTPFSQIRELDAKKFDYLCLGVAEEANTVALMNRARDWGVNLVTDHALIADKTAANRAIDKLITRSELLYLTIDIDVLPHYEAPGVSAPAARGVPFSTIEYLVGYVLSQSKKSGRPCPLVDIVELSPPNDPQNVTAKGAALLVRRILYS